MHRGFSLVELSIVMVILGLLVGGVLSGQSLIRAAELRAISTEYSRYYTAVQAFKDKYFAVPGDMSNAQSFWGVAHATAATCNTTPSTSALTCNGDGNGRINNSMGSNEQFRFWQHLANAGLIEGNYNGVQGAGGSDEAVIGTNVPRSKLSNAGWSIYYSANDPGNADVFANDFQNFFTFGGFVATGYTGNRVLKPEEAWNIDTKVDDGKPGMGRVIVRYIQECTNATGQTDITTTYKLTNTANQCALYYPRVL
jgi:prepilin-type N-terminal cleavage/methylation domain-containing protein